MHNSELSSQHEVLWCPDASNESKLAALAYLISSEAMTHTLVFISNEILLPSVQQTVSAVGVASAFLTKNSLKNKKLLNFMEGKIPVLITKDKYILSKKNKISDVNRVIMLAVPTSGEEYDKRLSQVLPAQQGLVCVIVLAKSEVEAIRRIMEGTEHQFKQRTVIGDVLDGIKAELSALPPSTQFSSPTTPFSLPSTNELKKFRGARSERNFFADIEAPLSGSGLQSISTVSVKSKQKKLRRKQKRRHERSENHLSASDSSDDDEEFEEEEEARGARVGRGRSEGAQRRRVPGRGASRKRPRNARASRTDALTNVGTKGVKKYRHALSKKDIADSAKMNPKSR